MVQEQQKEVKRAVIDRGKYQIRAPYAFLQIPESKWFTMNAQQRFKHLSKVQSLPMKELQEPIDVASPIRAHNRPSVAARCCL